MKFDEEGKKFEVIRGRIEKFDEIRGNLKSSRANRYSRYMYKIINNNLSRVKFLDYEIRKL